MARDERLPIYKAAPDMMVHFEKLVPDSSRRHTYTPGTGLSEGSRTVLQQVLRGNNAATRDAAAEHGRRDGRGKGVQVGAGGAHGRLILA